MSEGLHMEFSLEEVIEASELIRERCEGSLSPTAHLAAGFLYLGMCMFAYQIKVQDAPYDEVMNEIKGMIDSFADIIKQVDVTGQGTPSVN